MKRGCPTHPKMDVLTSILGCGKAQAVGHIEMLFHFCAEYSKDGAIGKWTDEMIAKRCGWDGDPTVFISALHAAKGCSSSGWVETHPEHRLIVHDWSEHADDSVHKYLAEHGLRFADGAKPRRKFQVATQSQLVATQSACLALPMPSHCHSHSLCLATWKEWIVYRMKRARCKDWIDLFQRQAELLGEWGPEKAIEAMKTSMANGWQGLFEPKSIKRKVETGTTRLKEGET